MHIYHLISPGPRPPFYKVAEHLWGACNFDSDGDSYDPETTNWTELTVALRDQKGRTNDNDRVDIDPVSLKPLILKVVSKDVSLCKAAAEFLHDHCGGRLEKI